MKKKKKINGVRVVIGATAILSFLCLWAFATREGTTLGKLMPGPIEVFAHLIETTYTKVGPMTIWGHMFNSLRRVLVGFTIASSAGILLGLAMGWNRTLEAIFRPIFELLRPIPPLAWISLAIVWFGLGEGGKYFLYQLLHRGCHLGNGGNLVGIRKGHEGCYHRFRFVLFVSEHGHGVFKYHLLVG